MRLELNFSSSPYYYFSFIWGSSWTSAQLKPQLLFSMNEVWAELRVRAQLEPSLCSRVYGIEWGEDIYPVACRRRAYILIRLRDKISRKKTWDFAMHITAKKTRDWLQKSRVLKPKHMTVNLMIFSLFLFVSQAEVRLSSSLYYY